MYCWATIVVWLWNCDDPCSYPRLPCPFSVRPRGPPKPGHAVSQNGMIYRIMISSNFLPAVAITNEFILLAGENTFRVCFF
jgi:hypothetical protein